MAACLQLVRRSGLPAAHVATGPSSIVMSRRCIGTRQTEFMHWRKREFWRGRDEKDQTPWHRKGLLPRLAQEGNKKKGEVHQLVFQRSDEWHPVEALKGQNDFVDIMGDGSIHPVRLLTNVPKWLRGFNGHEIQMLNRKWRAHKQYKETRPEEWELMRIRIDYLYAYLNLRKRPPEFEDY